MKEIPFTDKNPSFFHDANDFPSLRILKENFSGIQSELKEILRNSTSGYWLNTFPDYVSEESRSNWKVFTFRFFGIHHPLNCRVCPFTASLLSKIPDLVSADFSYLPAKTKIKPHIGFTRMVLRVHLGLIIPNKCGIRVGNENREWKEGELLIFDDSFEHEAWNNSNNDRFILMLDIANPFWNYTAEEICRYKIENLQDEFMLSIFPKDKWLEFFEKKEFDVPEMK
jgi:ornithine lipid ester-linked acyl 2-hydroxylase